jgi:hypothetical protein
MKKSIRFAIATGLLALAICTATAQSTNVEMPATFVLKGTVQTASGAKLVRVISKDIVAALNESGAYQFKPGATLLFVSSDDQPPLIMVHEGRGLQTTDTDVSDFFGVTEIGDAVRSPDDSTRWETWHFSFDNAATNTTGFQLWGETTIHRGAIHTTKMGTVTNAPGVQSTVTGVGRLNGAITIFSGSVNGANSAPVRSAVKP